MIPGARYYETIQSDAAAGGAEYLGLMFSALSPCSLRIPAIVITHSWHRDRVRAAATVLAAVELRQAARTPE